VEEDVFKDTDMWEGDIWVLKDCVDKEYDLLFVTSRRFELKEALFDEREHGSDEGFVVGESRETTLALRIDERSG
jgi:hypothetical protein